MIGPRFGSMRGRPDPRIGPSLFIAVPLPDAATDEIAALVRAVRRDPDRTDDAGRDPHDVRWVRMGALHLTLRFLGPTPADRIPEIGAIVDGVASSRKPFSVRLSGTGAFPSVDRPRTIWLGVTGGTDDLEALVGAIGEGLTSAGWPADDRPFRAHLTLARSDGVRSGPAVVEALGGAARDADFAVEFLADRIVLFESQTGKGAARYLALRDAPLRG